MQGGSTLVASPARRVLFLQCTNAAAYPPIMHAANLMADRGWSTHLLSSPEKDTASLQMCSRPGLTLHATRTRAQNAVRPTDYLAFLAKAVSLSMRLKPDAVYASDPLAAGPGLLAARLTGARLIYHEHDSPTAGALRPLLARLRVAAIRRAKMVVLPNAERGRLLSEAVGQAESKVRIVWNMPRKEELPSDLRRNRSGLTLYFHGSITPNRLPEAIVHALRLFEGRVKLNIAGYEAPGAPGYLDRLLQLGRCGEISVVEYLGQIPHRVDLLRAAAQADVGLSFMPYRTDDVNMRHMLGASNKPFDYMASRLALLVSDLPDWRALYVDGGFGKACDPFNVAAVAEALEWFLQNRAETQAMGNRGRWKIETDWNYDNALAPLLDELSRPCPSVPAVPL